MIIGHERTFISNWTTIQRLPGFCAGDEAAFKWVVQNLAVCMLGSDDVQRSCHHDVRYLNPKSLKVTGFISARAQSSGA